MSNMLEASAGSNMVKLETMTSIKSIPWSESRTGTDFPVLVRVTAPPQCTQRHSLDLVAVLDTSGSMLDEGKLGFMKEAMMFVIDNLGSDDRLSILPFRNIVTSNDDLGCPLREMSEENREELKTKVKALRTISEADDDVEAAKKAAQILEERSPDKSSSRIGRIIYLSDGIYTVKEEDVSSEYPVYTFGLGPDHSPETLKGISDKSKGVYSYVNENLEKMKDAFAQCIGGLTSVTAIDLEIKLQTHDGVSISSIECGSYESSFDNQVGTIKINDLYAGEKKNFIVYLTIPEGKEELMTISGSYKDGKNEIIQLGESKVFVKRPMDSTSNEVVHSDSEVAGELARLDLVKGIFTLSKEKQFEENELQMLWDGTVKSPNGQNAPKQTMSDLGKAVSAMQEEAKDGKRFFMSSWLTSQRGQRATTKGSPSESGDFQTTAMKNMFCRIADNKKCYHLEFKGKLKTISPMDVSSHPGWSKMEKALNMTMMTCLQDVGIASLFNGASVEDTRHAANRYLFLAIVHASILGSRCKSENDIANVSQLEADKKHLLDTLERANKRIAYLEKQLEDKDAYAKSLHSAITKTNAHLKTSDQTVVMLEAKVRKMEGIGQ